MVDMVYYTGFYLPAATIGKFEDQLANHVLAAWACAGLVLAIF